ncbi:MAG: DUF2585 domain-containing protein [Hyphomicrobiales bacterium]|nr:DUF2585 domain-containing protein [Hyphomicrobiales bacterium]
MRWTDTLPPRAYGLGVVAIMGALALVLLAMGRVPICTCGTVKLWHGVVASSENSQHISDWYSLSHVIHGLIFYWVLWLVGPSWPMGLRLVLAVLIESGWEIAENTDAVINRYREATISLDYYGDSVLNSVSDLGFMIVGFFAAHRLPVLASLGMALAFELLAATMIRDNLALNIIMLLYPLDSIQAWQAGG